VLIKLGLTLIPEDLCIFIIDSIIIFFYIDDIIIINYPEYAEEAAILDKMMKKQWEMRELDTNWFLNIRIVRDRS
jgi:hypothetical protein